MYIKSIGLIGEINKRKKNHNSPVTQQNKKKQTFIDLRHAKQKKRKKNKTQEVKKKMAVTSNVNTTGKWSER